MGTHPIFESDFDCLTELKWQRASNDKQDSLPPRSSCSRDSAEQLLAKNCRLLDSCIVCGGHSNLDSDAHSPILDCRSFGLFDHWHHCAGHCPPIRLQERQICVKGENRHPEV